MTANRRATVGRSAALVVAMMFGAVAQTARPLAARPSPVQTSQTAAAETGVRDALQRYSAALESRDAESVKKVQPSIQTEVLAKAFKDMRELKVVIDTVRVLSIDGATARVSCRVTQTLTPKAGSRQNTTVNRVMRLRRDSDVWVIDAFER